MASFLNINIVSLNSFCPLYQYALLRLTIGLKSRATSHMTTNQRRSFISVSEASALYHWFRISRRLMLSANQIQKRNPIWLVESRLLLTNADLLWVLLLVDRVASESVFLLLCLTLVTAFQRCYAIKSRATFFVQSEQTYCFFFQPIIKKKIKAASDLLYAYFPALSESLSIGCLLLLWFLVR